MEYKRMDKQKKNVFHSFEVVVKMTIVKDTISHKVAFGTNKNITRPAKMKVITNQSHRLSQ